MQVAPVPHIYMGGYVGQAAAFTQSNQALFVLESLAEALPQGLLHCALELRRAPHVRERQQVRSIVLRHGQLVLWRRIARRMGGCEELYGATSYCGRAHTYSAYAHTASRACMCSLQQLRSVCHARALRRCPQCGGLRAPPGGG